MTVEKSLQDFLKNHYPSFLSSDAAKAKIDALSAEKAATLLKVLEAEESGKPTFMVRDANFSDFYGFDLGLNALFSEILASKVPYDSLVTFRESDIFKRDQVVEVEEQAELQELGYRISSHRFTPEQLATVNAEIANATFVNRGIFSRELTGGEIFGKIRDGSIESYLGINGDTFWLKDQDAAAHSRFFQKLAFDPYILSMVSQYLGCAPVHVQTNLWFSFPTLKDKNNLSTNAQMYHQDKEFTKFIKVFIYLSDVGPDNGPHAYIVGSHIDEAHTHGFKFSDRIPDEDITKYYAPERIRSLVGPAGTITFGDTSCVHKGVPVEAGYRLMMQLEYASSLYLSAVPPFTALTTDQLAALPYPDPVRKRMTVNYNSDDRRAYQQMSAAGAAPEPSTFRKMLRLAKRYVKTKL
ncbi:MULTISPECIES: phytanoyl-CoA dioxygenase family protein [Rhizobium]|nr:MULTISPECIES: phytanoyl-CoA dioxygenase family protein [Rhizobium]